MKAITTFRCEICGNTFDSAEKCQICENSHIKPESIIEHPESYGVWQPYPDMIGIRFADGNTAEYVRADKAEGCCHEDR